MRQHVPGIVEGGDELLPFLPLTVQAREIIVTDPRPSSFGLLGVCLRHPYSSAAICSPEHWGRVVPNSLLHNYDILWDNCHPGCRCILRVLRHFILVSRRAKQSPDLSPLYCTANSACVSMGELRQGRKAHPHVPVTLPNGVIVLDTTAGELTGLENALNLCCA